MGVVFVDKQYLPKLSQQGLDRYERQLGAEANRLWAEFEQTPCRESLDAWRKHWDEEIAPVMAEQTRRFVARAAERTGLGGVQV